MRLPLVAARNRTKYYLDSASATPVAAKVFQKMEPYFSLHFANPSSIHRLGLVAREAVNEARRQVARLIAARPDEIVFTSGATESVNLALVGAARALKGQGNHIVTVATEHAATLEVLKREGFTVTFVPVGPEGEIRAEQVLSRVRADTILVSVMYVNNELGVVAPLSEIGKGLARHRKDHRTLFPLFHSDATQAVGLRSVDVEKLHLDLMSFAASKMYGPKGVGALYVRRGVRLTSLIVGGNQEQSLRAGTENVSGIVGFGEAARLAWRHRARNAEHLGRVRSAFLKTLKKFVPNIRLNGEAPETVPSIINLSFPGLDGEELLLRLDARGVCASAASACKTSDHPSHVLRAIGRTEDEVKGSLRFSFLTTMSVPQAKRAAKIVGRVVRAMKG